MVVVLMGVALQDLFATIVHEANMGKHFLMESLQNFFFLLSNNSDGKVLKPKRLNQLICARKKNQKTEIERSIQRKKREQ